jgi:hypothetical protein
VDTGSHVLGVQLADHGLGLTPVRPVRRPPPRSRLPSWKVGLPHDEYRRKGGHGMRVGMVIVSEYEANPRVRRQAEALAARGDEVTVPALRAPDRPREEVVDGVAQRGRCTCDVAPGTAWARLQVLGSGDGLPAVRTRVNELRLQDAVSLPERLIPVTEIRLRLNQVFRYLEISGTITARPATRNESPASFENRQ